VLFEHRGRLADFGVARSRLRLSEEVTDKSIKRLIRHWQACPAVMCEWHTLIVPGVRATKLVHAHDGGYGANVHYNFTAVRFTSESTTNVMHRICTMNVSAPPATDVCVGKTGC
jgi:hypothetical protein